MKLPGATINRGARTLNNCNSYAKTNHNTL